MNPMRWGLAVSFCLHISVAAAMLAWPTVEADLSEMIISVELAMIPSASDGGEGAQSSPADDSDEAAPSSSTPASEAAASDREDTPRNVDIPPVAVPETAVADPIVPPLEPDIPLIAEQPPPVPEEAVPTPQEVVLTHPFPPPPKPSVPVAATVTRKPATPPSPPAQAQAQASRDASGRQGREISGKPAEAVGESGAAAGNRAAEYRLGASATPLPDYPWSARRRGQEGRVVIRLAVDAEGKPIQVDVAESSGEPILDRAATETLKTWRLKPAVRNGLAVASVLNVPIRFKLREGDVRAGESAGEK